MQVKNYDGDVADLCLTFSVEDSFFGASQSRALLPGGGDQAVTNTNKLLFVHLLVRCVGPTRAAAPHMRHACQATPRHSAGGLALERAAGQARRRFCTRPWPDHPHPLLTPLFPLGEPHVRSRTHSHAYAPIHAPGAACTACDPFPPLGLLKLCHCCNIQEFNQLISGASGGDGGMGDAEVADLQRCALWPGVGGSGGRGGDGQSSGFLLFCGHSCSTCPGCARAAPDATRPRSVHAAAPRLASSRAHAAAPCSPVASSPSGSRMHRQSQHALSSAQAHAVRRRV